MLKYKKINEYLFSTKTSARTLQLVNNYNKKKNETNISLFHTTTQFTVNKSKKILSKAHISAKTITHYGIVFKFYFLKFVKLKKSTKLSLSLNKQNVI